MKWFLLRAASLPWPVQSLVVCAAFLVVGIIIVDNYGAGLDSANQRSLTERNLAFITGDADQLEMAHSEYDRYYGIAFELPLLLLERGLGLEDSRSHSARRLLDTRPGFPLERDLRSEDSRSLYLMRHLVTHGFFLIGGLCCSLLVYRLSNRRGVALVALLLFLLQPRLYAHSFFNSKDLPFLSMFMVTLYVTHRAFRKKTIGAFLLCGVSVGVLTNLRIMGLMLYSAVLVLRGLDVVQARGRGRKQVLATGAVFALAGPGMLYALSPYLWENPLEFVTAVQTLAQRPHPPAELFQGRLVQAPNLPWHYIPTWMGISTPSVTLVCGVLGVIVVGMRSIREPRTALGNTDLRVGLLLVVCLTLPVVAIVMLGSHMYDGWRLVFFLHAPLCCLAGLGLQGVRGKVGSVAYAPIGIGMAVIIGEMISLHPSQLVYFNSLVDRTTPEFLRTQYVIDARSDLCGSGLKFLRRRYPGTTVFVHDDGWLGGRSWVLLTREDRSRLVMDQKDPDVRIWCGKTIRVFEKEGAFENVIYAGKLYNNTLVTVTARVTVPDRTRSFLYRTARYRGVVAGRLGKQATFDVYTYPGARLLGYVREGCTAADVEAQFFLHIVPVEVADLPAARRQYGFDNLDFHFNAYSVSGHREKGQCWASVVLPDYPISRIRTGQFLHVGSNQFKEIWKVELSGPVPWSVDRPRKSKRRDVENSR